MQSHTCIGNEHSIAIHVLHDPEGYTNLHHAPTKLHNNIQYFILYSFLTIIHVQIIF